MITDSLFMFLIVILCAHIFILHRNKMYSDKYYTYLLKSLSTKKVKDPVKITETKINIARPIDIIRERDKAVIHDTLYPPVDRMSRPIADEYLKYKMDGVFGVNTRDTSDTFRLVAYLINSVDRADKWNVFGRQKYRGSNQGEYYIVQQCNSHGPCSKIMLTDDIILNNQLRDYYNLPSTITFKSPLLDTTPYDVVQLKTNVNFGPYF